MYTVCRCCLPAWLVCDDICHTFMYVLPFTDHLQLKNEAVSLVDVIAPPDFILQSPIGSSNGEV